MTEGSGTKTFRDRSRSFGADLLTAGAEGKNDVAHDVPAGEVDELKFINPKGLYDPRPNAYSHLAVFPAGWRMILPAGQGGETEDGGLAENFGTQLRQALANTATVLAAAGATMSDVAKFNLLVVDHNEEKFGMVRQEFDRVWGDRKPAWTLIPVPALALDGMLIEIDVIAVVPQ
ncbi:RidA family protein [Micromonospora sp. NPDC050276]|uniref:RidA family protein n=1 Tax=Micromonospora sp. NPDC050276 TaxID=3364278 RepID=UPI0037BE17AE